MSINNRQSHYIIFKSIYSSFVIENNKKKFNEYLFNYN